MDAYKLVTLVGVVLVVIGILAWVNWPAFAGMITAAHECRRCGLWHTVERGRITQTRARPEGGYRGPSWLA